MQIHKLFMGWCHMSLKTTVPTMSEDIWHPVGGLQLTAAGPKLTAAAAAAPQRGLG